MVVKYGLQVGCLKAGSTNPPVKIRDYTTMTMQCEWYTPPNIIDLAREVLGTINVDPASNTIAQEWIKADTFLQRILTVWINLGKEKYGLIHHTTIQL